MFLILTLTTTSKRLMLLKYTLLSLCNQSLKPDQIVLNISKGGYLIDEGIQNLPSWLEELETEKKVAINWVENTGPYRKLLPVYDSSSENDWLVTCDDDVIYGEEWLASLVKTANDHLNAIVCGRARVPVKAIGGGNQSYLHWKVAPLGSIGFDLLPTGVAGVLYRKPLLDEYIMKSNDFRTIAPKQDDLWFNLARQMKGTVVVVSEEAGKYVYPVEAPGALTETNASVKHKGWENFFSAITGRVVIKIKAVLGYSVCDNDVSMKHIEIYKSRFK